jgi:small subunit ribosomal protein S20
MPVIKSAKKQMRQNVKRRARNFPLRSELKSLMKKELKYIKDGNFEEADKFLKDVYSVIDTSCKKKIIHRNNAARKKSLLARALNDAKNKKKGL